MKISRTDNFELITVWVWSFPNER